MPVKTHLNSLLLTHEGNTGIRVASGMQPLPLALRVYSWVSVWWGGVPWSRAVSHLCLTHPRHLGRAALRVVYKRNHWTVIAINIT